MQIPPWSALSPFAFLAALLSLGCGDGGTAVEGLPAVAVAAVALTPAAAALPRDGTQNFTASITDAAGMPIVCPEAMVWSSSDSMVARVFSFGNTATVAALAQGGAQIRGTCRDVTGTATLTVGLPEVVLVAISPASASVRQDATQGFTASVTDFAGAPLACPALVWSSSDSAVARVSSTGAAAAVATPVRVGAAQIRATCGNGVGTAALTVRPPLTAASVTLDPASATLARDASRSISATVRNFAGEVVPCPEPLVWSSGNPVVVQVSATGAAAAEATARGSGVVQLRATCQDATGTATITVPRPAVEQIAFLQNEEIFRINQDGSGLKNLSNSPDWDLVFGWSPDGTRMVFRKDIRYDTHLVVMNADGSGQRSLTTVSGAVNCPVWSPDGTRIAYGSYRIWVIDADGSNHRQLTRSSGQYGVVEEDCPVWSPDGSRIALLRATGDLGNPIPEIILINADGSNPRAVRTGVPRESYQDLRWSPDGTRLAFVIWVNFTPRVIVMNVDGTGVRQLTDVPSKHPEWSSDGTKLVFVVQSGDWDLHVANADGTGVRNVLDNAEDDRNPSWSPDGTKIVFESGYRIFVVDADGSRPTALTSGYLAHDPAWRP